MMVNATLMADSATALRNLLALPNVRCEDEPAVVGALAWSLQGLDFVDALHLASSGPTERFTTFDTDLIKAASGLSEIPVVEA